MNNRALLWALGIGALIMFGFGAKKIYDGSRGLRNNNPGNIRHNQNIKWQGTSAVQQDQSFVTFDSPEMGIRALATVLKNYFLKYGYNNVRVIVNRWAPPSENDTESYIKSVTKQTGFDPDKKLELNRDTLEKLAKAIIKHENGINPYPDSVVKKAIKMVV